MVNDPVSGKNYDHRKQWLEDRLKRFAASFGIDLLCFSILSNHFHLVLRSRPDVVATWDESGSSGSPQTGTAGLNGLGSIAQGSLETSNVNTVEELVNMIETQRAYEMNSKAISTAERMLEYANNNL